MSRIRSSQTSSPGLLRLVVVALVLLGTLVAPGVPAAAVASVALAATGSELPAPTGGLLIGTKSLYLRDTARSDPWKPDTPFRELMATLWYPALASSAREAPYMSGPLSTAIVGSDVLSTVRTHAAVEPVPLPGPWPLVVLSAGFGMTRLSLTALAEDLTSHGYVVIAVDHTYEAAVEFPGGRLEPCLICAAQQGPDVVRSRVADLRFVLDRLTSPSSGLIFDRSRIAVVGHAIGGSAAVDLLGEDTRVDAAATMDGTFFTPPPAQPVDRPVLLLGAQWPTAGGTPAANWVERWSSLSGWKRWLSVPSDGHASFSDVHWLYETFDLTQVIPPAAVPALLGTISGTRATVITRGYVGAFVDWHLWGAPRPLLDQPCPDFPEVQFVYP